LVLRHEIVKLRESLDEQKAIYSRNADKHEEHKSQLAKLKKLHKQELDEKLDEASKVRATVEQENVVLKEMVKSVNMQLKSKDTDI
jgi:hypothetical protein